MYCNKEVGVWELYDDFTVSPNSVMYHVFIKWACVFIMKVTCSILFLGVCFRILNYSDISIIIIDGEIGCYNLVSEQVGLSGQAIESVQYDS